MTTLIYNASAVPALRTEAELEISKATAPERTKLRHTLASRLAVLTICVMIVLTTMAYGTVHYWALAVFAATAAGMVCLWCLDGLVLRSVRLSDFGSPFAILERTTQFALQSNGREP